MSLYGVTEDKLNSIGKRIRALRSLCALSRKEFSLKHHLKEASLRSWELDLMNISSGSLSKLIEAFKSEQLICQPEWILTGEGYSPIDNSKLKNLVALKNNLLPNSFDDSSIQQEIEFFLNLGSNRITSIITNNDLKPVFSKGDIVGAFKINVEHISQYKDYYFIVKGSIIKDYITVCTLQYDDQYSKYLLMDNSLLINNINTKIINIEDLELIAPIIWHRRKFQIYSDKAI